MFQPNQLGGSDANSQLESWNMANDYMKMVAGVIATIIDIWQNPYKDGMPRYGELPSNLRILKTLASVYLDETELEEADKFIYEICIVEPIVDTGHTTIIPYATEEKLWAFLQWVLKKLKAKGAIVPPQFDPDMAL